MTSDSHPCRQPSRKRCYMMKNSRVSKKISKKWMRFYLGIWLLRVPRRMHRQVLAFDQTSSHSEMTARLKSISRKKRNASSVLRLFKAGLNSYQRVHGIKTSSLIWICTSSRLHQQTCASSWECLTRKT